MSKFNIGDIVCLKSGGPDITVEVVYTSEMKGQFAFESRLIQMIDFRGKLCYPELNSVVDTFFPSSS